MMAAMMLMAGGMAFAQQPEQPEAPKQENPAPEQKPDEKSEPTEKSEPEKTEKTEAPTCGVFVRSPFVRNHLVKRLFAWYPAFGRGIFMGGGVLVVSVLLCRTPYPTNGALRLSESAVRSSATVRHGCIHSTFGASLKRRFSGRGRLAASAAKRNPTLSSGTERNVVEG